VNQTFEPFRLGGVHLPHQRTGPVTAPVLPHGELTAEYHPHPAGAGLVIAEAVHPGVADRSDLDHPAGCSPEQAEAWRRVTDAVHDQGDRIFLRLTRSGRIGHPYLQPDGALPLTPSEIPFADVIRAIGDSVSAAREAVDAGFDGVELHGGNGHLLPRFPFDDTTTRFHVRGDSVEKRIRFAVEVVRAVSDAIGPQRTAIRISPTTTRDGTADSKLFTTLARTLAPHGLAFLHLVETGNRDMRDLVRAEWPGVLIVTPHRTLEASPAIAPRNGPRDGVARLR
jgi:N-ethylmaleimide reductase